MADLVERQLDSVEAAVQRATYMYPSGICSPVIISVILGAAVTLAAWRERHRLSNGVQFKHVLLSSLSTVLFMWLLCYNGFEAAAWFFLLVPILVGGMALDAFALLKRGGSSQFLPLQ